MILKLIKRIPPTRLAAVLYFFYKCWCKSLRFTVEGRDAVDALERENKPIMFSLWHDEMFSIIWQRKTLKAVTVVSQSQDGEYLAQVLQALGFKTARGSSSRGAISALLQASKIMAKERYCGCITVDGPKGPRHKVKDGAIFLAYKTPAPIVPMRMFARHCIRFGSWDKFQLPLPFSRVHVIFGAPYLIEARKLTEEALETERQKLQHVMDSYKAPDDFYRPFSPWKYAVYSWLASMLQKLSLHSLHTLAKGMAWLTWHCMPSRRNYAIEAVAKHVQVPTTIAKHIARQSFDHNFVSFLEIFYSSRLYQSQQFSPIPDSPGLKLFLADKGPVVIATAHLGSWELMEPYAAFLQPDKKRLVVVREQKDKALNRLMLELRTAGGVTAVGHRQAAEFVKKYLRENGLAAFLVDHNTHRREAVFLPFLQDTAAVNMGPALLALRAKATIYPSFLLRNEQGEHSLYIDAPLATTTLKGSIAERTEQIARYYTDAVARAVLRNPEQWFWMHRRWKTRQKHS